MIKVKLNEATDDIEIKFKYDVDYIQKIKGIVGAKWNPDTKVWTMPSLLFEGFERLFKGEIMYITPRWVIKETQPPDYSKIYSEIPNKHVILKAPYKLYPFQSFGANFLVHQVKKYKLACLFDDMGTGKTITSIAASIILNSEINLNNYEIPNLVICKSGLKFQWVTDGIDKFTNETSIVIDGGKKKRRKLYDSIKKNPGTYKYVIVGYETIRNDIDILKDFKIGLVISDEAHKIRNRKTKVNTACAKLKAQYYFFLTGSPINGEPDGIFGLSKVGNPKFLGTWTSFEKEYIRYRRTKYGVDKFYKNLDKLTDKTNDISIRRTDKEIDLQLPKIMSHDVYIDMSPQQIMIDEIIIKDFQCIQAQLNNISCIRDLEKRKEIKNKLEGSVKGLMALRVGAADSPELFILSHSAMVRNKYGSLVTNLKSGKIDYLKEQVSEILDSGHKVVIFTKFETMVRILHRELSKMNLCEIAMFTGKMNARQKEESRIRFKTRSDCNIFISTNAGAEGLNLQEAKYLINLDLDWDVGINDQRNKRIRRLDSSFDRVFVTNYISRYSADELVLKALENKKDVIDCLIENNSLQTQQMKQAMSRF